MKVENQGKPERMAPARKSPEQKLADLEAQESQLKARIQKERAKVSDRKRKEDTRRKIVAGALILEHAESNPESETALTLNRLLRDYVKAHERHLFGLDPLPDNSGTDAPEPDNPPPPSSSTF